MNRGGPIKFGEKRMAWLTTLDHYTLRARSREGLVCLPPTSLLIPLLLITAATPALFQQHLGTLPRTGPRKCSVASPCRALPLRQPWRTISQARVF